MTHLNQTPSCPALGAQHSQARTPIFGGGRIEFGSAGAVDATETKLPAGFSCTRTDTGIYTLTVPETYDLFVVATFFDASGGGLYCNGKTNSSTSCIFSVWDGGTPTAAQPADGDAIGLVFQGWY